MKFATIDCGTTNSRIYIVNEQAEVLGKAAKKVGVRDTAIHGSNQILKDGLQDIFYQAAENANCALNDISFAISSGMITSEIGLLELSHLWAPVGMGDLAENITKVHDTSIFPVDLPIYFIHGIKNRYNPETATFQDVGLLDFMRGEETQIAGLLATHEPSLPVTVMVLSSHTKCIPIDAARRILGSVTTVSGQVYEALLKETFIGKSIRRDDDFDDSSYLDRQIIDLAYTRVQEAGFLRSLVMTRFLDVLLSSTWYERKLFVEAVIAAEDMQALRQFKQFDFPSDPSFILIGEPKRCALYAHLLREKLHITQDILTITETADIDVLSIEGAIALAQHAGLF